jgi:peptide/nickel transport system permease protein
MRSFILSRLLLTLLVVATTSILAFSLIHLSGDPAAAVAGSNASPADIEMARTVYGFDLPIWQQYFNWVRKVLTGDFGQSFYLRLPVVEVLSEYAPVTARLGLCALGFALLVSVPLGVGAALRPNTSWDRGALWIAVAGQAIPSFLLALGLIYVFGVWLRWLPISGGTDWQFYVLPTVTLGYSATPALTRLTRSGMLDVLQSDHVRTARAFGLAPWRVIVRHGLRHAIVPVVSLAAVQLGFMLGGSIVIESTFALKGLGFLAWQSIQRADIWVIQAILLVIATTYALLTLAADLLNALLDPRLRGQ